MVYETRVKMAGLKGKFRISRSTAGKRKNRLLELVKPEKSKKWKNLVQFK
jgi:hypothetical protein